MSTHTKIPTLSLALTLTLASLAQEASTQTPLDLLLQQHRTEIDKLDLSKAAKVAALNPKYEAALDRIKKRHQAADDFEATIAVAHEIKTYTSSPRPDDPPSPGNPSPELLEAKKTYARSMAKIQREIDAVYVAKTQDTIDKLRALAAKYASADKLDAAIAADAARKQLESSEDYTSAIARLKTTSQPGGKTPSIGMATGLPRQGLVAHFRFEGNLRDANGGADIRLGGKKAYASGVVGRAVSFDNGHDKEKNYIDFPLPDGGSSSFSLSFCARLDLGAHSSKAIVGIGTGDTEDLVRFDFQRKGGDKVAIQSVSGGDWQHADGGAPRPDPEWHHIVITFEPSLINYYVNGHLMTSLEPREPFDTSGMTCHVPMTYYMRRTDNGGREVAINAGLDALIDELAIYGRALRTNEIKAISKFYRLDES